MVAAAAAVAARSTRRRTDPRRRAGAWRPRSPWLAARRRPAPPAVVDRPAPWRRRSPAARWRRRPSPRPERAAPSVVVATASPALVGASGVIVIASRPTSSRPTVAAATIRSRPPRVAGSGGGPGSSDGWRHGRSWGAAVRSSQDRKSTDGRHGRSVARAPRRADRARSGGTGGETAPATMRSVLNAPATATTGLRSATTRCRSPRAYDWAVRPDCGAVVLFSGDRPRPRRRPRRRRALVYEAYEDAVAHPLRRDRVRGLRERGRRSGASPCSTAPALAVGECAVVAVVSAPHRAEAFEAAASRSTS